MSTSISRLSGEPPSLGSSVRPPSPSSVRGGGFTTGGGFVPRKSFTSAGDDFVAGGGFVGEGDFVGGGESVASGDFAARDDEGGVYPEASPEEPSERAPGVSMPRPLATPFNPSGGAKLDTMIEAVLPCTTAQVSCCLSARFLCWGD